MTFWTALAWFLVVAGAIRLWILLSGWLKWDKESRGNILAQAQLGNHYGTKVHRTLLVVAVSVLWLIFG